MKNKSKQEIGMLKLVTGETIIGTYTKSQGVFIISHPVVIYLDDESRTATFRDWIIFSPQKEYIIEENHVVVPPVSVDENLALDYSDWVEGKEEFLADGHDLYSSSDEEEDDNSNKSIH